MAGTFFDYLGPDARKQIIAQGLLGLGSGLLSAAGPSTVPQNLAGGLGQGLQGFQNAYQQALSNQMTMKQFTDQQEEAKRAQELATRDFLAREALATATAEGNKPAALRQLGQLDPGAAFKSAFPDVPTGKERYGVNGNAVIDYGAEGGPQVLGQLPTDPLKQKKILADIEAANARAAASLAAAGLSTAKTENLGAPGEAEATATSRNRAERIEDYKRVYGVDEKTAMGLADGLLQVYQDPTTGQPFIINRAGAVSGGQDGSGSAQAVQVPGINFTLTPDTRSALTNEVAAGERVTTMIDGLLADLESPSVQRPETRAGALSTGMRGALQTLIRDPLSQIDPSLADRQVADLRRRVGALKQELVTNFINNPKYPVAEQERIQKEILNIETGITGSAESLKNALISLRGIVQGNVGSAQGQLTEGTANVKKSLADEYGIDLE